MENEAPDLYTDAIQIGMSAFGVVLSCQMQSPAGAASGQPPVRVCNLRMSLEHDKVLAMLLRKQLKNLEEQMNSEIPLATQVYQQLGLSKQEDW